MGIKRYSFTDAADYTFDPLDVVVANGQARLKDTVGVFPVGGGSLTLAVPVTIRELRAVSEIVEKDHDDDVTYGIIIGSTEYYFDGQAWLESSGYDDSNSLAEINDEVALSYLKEFTEAGVAFNLKIYLYSDNSYTPTLHEVTFEYFSADDEIVPPSVSIIWGYVFNTSAQPVENCSVSAVMKREVIYDGDRYLANTSVSTKTDASGYWELSLVDNERMAYLPDKGLGAPYYTFKFSGLGINFSEKRRVISIAKKAYTELEIITGE